MLRHFGALDVVEPSSRRDATRDVTDATCQRVSCQLTHCLKGRMVPFVSATNTTMTTTTTITTITNGPSAGPAQSLGGAQSGAPGAGVGTAAPNNGTGAPNRGAGYLPGVVLTVVGSANKSVHVTTPGGVTPMYSMATAFEGRREVVTIAHGAPAPTGPTKLVRPGTNGGEAPLARLELHGLLADKLSLHGAPAVKFSHWLVGTGACVAPSFLLSCSLF